MSNCVFIDLGDGDFIKPSFSKPPTPEMIEGARQWGLKMKQETKEFNAKGLCSNCKGEGKTKRRDLDAPGFAFAMFPCQLCKGTGKYPASPQVSQEGE